MRLRAYIVHVYVVYVCNVSAPMSMSPRIATLIASFFFWFTNFQGIRKRSRADKSITWSQRVLTVPNEFSRTCLLLSSSSNRHYRVTRVVSVKKQRRIVNNGTDTIPLDQVVYDECVISSLSKSRNEPFTCFPF